MTLGRTPTKANPGDKIDDQSNPLISGAQTFPPPPNLTQDSSACDDGNIASNSSSGLNPINTGNKTGTIPKKGKTTEIIKEIPENTTQKSRQIIDEIIDEIVNDGRQEVLLE